MFATGHRPAGIASKRLEKGQPDKEKPISEAGVGFF